MIKITEQINFNDKFCKKTIKSLVKKEKEIKLENLDHFF